MIVRVTSILGIPSASLPPHQLSQNTAEVQNLHLHFCMTWILFAVTSDVYVSVLFMLSVSVSKHILLQTSAIRGGLLNYKKKIEKLFYTGINRNHFLRIPHKLSAALREKTLEDI